MMNTIQAEWDTEQRVSSTTLAKALVLGCMMLASCGPAPSLMEAQRTFSEGARLELQQESEEYLAGGLRGVADGDPFTFYVDAEKSLSALIAKEEAALRADRLFGHAMVLHGLALWRLWSLSEGTANPYNSAFSEQLLKIKSGRDVTDESKAWVLGTRDRALSKALPGFRDVELGRTRKKYDGDGGAEKAFRSAMKQFEEAVEGSNNIPEDHPVRLYLTAVTLRALALWMEGITGAAKEKKCDMICEDRLDEDISGFDKDGQKVVDKSGVWIRGVNQFAKDTVCSSKAFLQVGQDDNRALINRLLVPIGQLSLLADNRGKPSNPNCEVK